MLLSFECISISSFHLRSAQDNAKKYFGHPNCFTVAKISPWIFFRYAGVPLIWFMNKKHLSFEKMIHILNIPYASRLPFPWSYWFGLLILSLYHRLCKKYIIYHYLQWNIDVEEYTRTFLLKLFWKSQFFTLFIKQNVFSFLMEI